MVTLWNRALTATWGMCGKEGGKRGGGRIREVKEREKKTRGEMKRWIARMEECRNDGYSNGRNKDNGEEKKREGKRREES